MSASARPVVSNDESSTRLRDFDFELPAALIAQHPAPERDGARLMTVERVSGAVGHRRIRDLPELLEPGDLLVVNDTRVLPARITGHVGAAKAELLLIRPVNEDGDVWRCLGKPGRKLQPGSSFALVGGADATVIERHDDETFDVRFAENVMAMLDAHGELPLPPYIRRPEGPDATDRERYQTVFANEAGAVAAPTAGLHFTERLLSQLNERGIERVALTLHVGPGTFLPVRCEDARDHPMHAEWCEIPEATAAAINRAKAEGRRVIAIGTTTTRALESAGAREMPLRAQSGWADRFLLPGEPFHVIDALFTNFHLPKSTLLMLVSALAGRDLVLAAYAEAVRREYRFYSYGDAMLIT